MLKKYLVILKKYKVPKGIISHILGVAKISDFLALKFLEKGFKVNRENVLAGAMLHDIDKVISGDVHLHGQNAKKILKKEGIGKEIIDIIKNHPAKKIFQENFFSLADESKIVYYSDKIFKQKICSIEERVKEWQLRMKKSKEKRYSMDKKEISKMIKLMKKLEKEILSKAGMNFFDIRNIF